MSRDVSGFIRVLIHQQGRRVLFSDPHVCDPLLGSIDDGLLAGVSRSIKSTATLAPALA